MIRWIEETCLLPVRQSHGASSRGRPRRCRAEAKHLTRDGWKTAVSAEGSFHHHRCTSDATRLRPWHQGRRVQGSH